MKYKKLFITLIMVCPFILTFYNSCGNVKFTSTNISVMGNPLKPTQASQEILFSICSVLDRCQSQVSFNTCMTGVMSTSGIATTLGLPAGTYDPFSSLENAEASGTVVANSNNTNTCVDTINNLSCSSPNVINAYNPTNSNPFAGVPGMIPTQACGQVFSNTYEYIYFGDQNALLINGYSINESTGVLTAISNPPSTANSTQDIALDKISSSMQLLQTARGGGAYLIAPTTGILSAVSGTYGALGAGAFSPSGLFSFNTGSAGCAGDACISSVNPTTGNFYNSSSMALTAPVSSPRFIIVSPNGSYIYILDSTHNAIEGMSTSGGTLNILTGAGSGTGVNAGDKTYGITDLATPNAGQYDTYYVDAAANVIYLVYFGNPLAQNNTWVMPFQINSDGSLTTGTPTNLGTDPHLGDLGGMVGDSQGKYLFVTMPSGSIGTMGINTYSIGANGNLTYVSTVDSGTASFQSIVINAENSLVISAGNFLYTHTLDMTTGKLTFVNSVAIGNTGALTLDPSENFVYSVNGTVAPCQIYGYTINSSGVLGAIAGQTYPMNITGSQSIISSQTVRISP